MRFPGASPLSILPVLLTLAAGGSVLQAADMPALKHRLDNQISPLLETYCLDCHDSATTKGDFNLEPLLDKNASRLDIRLWDKIREQVRTKAMPPAKRKEQPADDQRALLSAWVADAENAVRELPATDPGFRKARRLTRREYSLTLRDLLYGARDNLGDIFPADGAGGEGFDNNADTLFIPPLLIEKFIAATDAGLQAAWEKPEIKKRLIAQLPDASHPPAEAARASLQIFARRAWRRPVTENEITPLVKVFETASKRGQAFELALRTAFKAVLLSPKFLILQEAERPGEKNPWRISSHEMAQRLSYFLWSTMPDDELFRLAEENRLQDDAVIRAQVARMLDDKRAETFVKHFTGQWLGLDALFNTVDPDRRKYPEFTPSLRQAMYDEGLSFAGSILRGNGSVLEFLDSRHTFANEELSKLYGIPDVKGPELRRVNLPDDKRGGVLGMAAVLASTSYPQRTSPVLRGKWVLETLLGTPAPPPPANVGSLPEDDRSLKELTFRQQLEKHRSKEQCMGCHNRLDPPGFGLENFDPIGKWRDNENGKALDATGNFVGGDSFKGPAEMRRLLLKEQDKFIRNFTARMLGYALGRGLEPADQPTQLRLERLLVENNHRARPLITAIATSHAFTHRRNSH